MNHPSITLIIISLLLCSCVRATKDEVVAFAGKGAYNGRDFSLVWDHDESVKSIVNGAIAAVGLYGAAAANEAAELTSRTANTNATKQAINANNNATSLAKEGLKAGVESEAINKGAPLLPR